MFEEDKTSNNGLSLTESDVYYFFGSTYAGRGNSYQRGGRVLSAKLDRQSKRLVGKVQGTDRRPYDVEIRLAGDLESIGSTDCSCPMGRSCKHCAAVVLDVIRSGRLDHSAFASSLSSSNQKTSLLPGEDDFWGNTGAVTPQRNYPKPADYLETLSQAIVSNKLTEWVDSVCSALASQPGATRVSSNDSVIYLLDVVPGQNRLVLNVAHGKKLKSGAWGKLQKADLARFTGFVPPAYVTDEDCEIAKLFMSSTRDSVWPYRNTFPEIPEICQIVLQRILSTGRCYWKELSDTALCFGAEKKGVLQWETQADGKQVLRLYSSTGSDITVIAGVGWYINLRARLLGPLTLPASAKVIKTILNAPPIEPTEAVAVSKALAKVGSLIPAPKTDFSIKTVTLTPTAKLTLTMEEPSGYWNYQLWQEDREGAGIIRLRQRKI